MKYSVTQLNEMLAGITPGEWRNIADITPIKKKVVAHYERNGAKGAEVCEALNPSEKGRTLLVCL